VRTNFKQRRIIGRQLNGRSASEACCSFVGAALLALVLALFGSTVCAATLSQGQQGPIPPPASGASKPQPQESSSKNVGPGESAVPTLPAKSDFDPLDSEKDVEVGLFYMHKGDVDAAIPRFEDAIRLRDNYAEPRRLLGEAYEKKRDKPDAVRYYKEYLHVYPSAPDAKKIQNKIDKLSGK
jgi:tetratricopeptide (TPR) repeat protein